MSLIFFYDTETTGLPAFSEPSDAPHQPHLVQVAASLVNATTRKVISSIDVLVKPDGWTIPEEVTRIHGITNEQAEQCGLDESLVTELVLDMWRLSDVRIGHVESFDARILRIALKRYATAQVADEWKAGTAQCTAKAAKALMGTTKNPKLIDAHRHFLGREFDGAHTAHADMVACREIHWAMADHESA
ncbi:TPA: 3'-5' exonuclease [Stenotrophomonas maltophilia]|jgi:DNA polymerase-3 subunit epsilon|uniref:3'-5' exonuclease n=1 Tax=Stenotrophomonas maltophilia TaxID=40324 RepID=UPI0013DADE04|nr:3'-5' exonuclease [Stenotrophomonas maltophilia]EKU9979134.1 3'-5' exonuclease [Stenotrophomonas maltophilia]EKX6271003.1 3'-5' exonuclease [Stenotrophomonas maltophilia]MBS6053997.1 3'-5' exonuclease [Stenotrophomonas maltophilia]MDG9766123.1 3'-5' exonuclease [Stenotrophomonas maltophilia]MDG9910345.1 3'-5' exonuclease [Stenotrophomonas maltophilia]